ncbi:MAG: coproporphyrinogen dehydrogenase HemZ, partial [Acutalibacteraceae bacterium]
MILRVLGHKFHYEAENLCRVFYPFEKISVVRDLTGEDNLTVVTKLEKGEASFIITVSADIKGNDNISHEQTADLSADEDSLELEMMKMLFSVLSEVTGYTPKWGILTGVRPSKLMTSLVESLGGEEAKKYFTDALLVKKDKAELAYNVACAEKKIIDLSKPKSFSLYISIPFCPTRCNYCSFVSHSIDQAQKL